MRLVRIVVMRVWGRSGLPTAGAPVSIVEWFAPCSSPVQLRIGIVQGARGAKRVLCSGIVGMTETVEGLGLPCFRYVYLRKFALFDAVRILSIGFWKLKGIFILSNQFHTGMYNNDLNYRMVLRFIQTIQ